MRESNDSYAGTGERTSPIISLPHVRTHKGSKVTVLSFLFCVDAVREGGACTVIGRIHSHFSLPSIIRGCSYLTMNDAKLIETP